MLSHLWSLQSIDATKIDNIHPTKENVSSLLTHCGLVMPYDDIGLAQCWLR